jgi:hypothetical protein
MGKYGYGGINSREGSIEIGYKHATIQLPEKDTKMVVGILEKYIDEETEQITDVVLDSLIHGSEYRIGDWILSGVIVTELKLSYYRNVNERKKNWF